MAKEIEKPAVPVSQQGANNGMRKYMIYRKQKKTTRNPEGETLLTVTFAPSAEEAERMAYDMIEARDGKPFRIVDVADTIVKA